MTDFDPAWPAYYVKGYREEFMKTPFEQGHLAGYRAEPEANPYRKGVPMLWTADMICWAQLWDAGYVQGRADGHDDVLAKRRDGCR